jgi:TolB-like protein/class 3 adenylate cyclase/Flp pilus assembly protein TadD
MARRLAAIVFTDIAGYTSLSQTDEPGALRLLQDQERLVRGLLEVHQGRLVKSMGDGLLIEFGNALDAVECAVDLQGHIQHRNAREPPPELRVRIGIHLGDVEGAGSDILGDAVNVASRIEPLAEPGGVCVSEPVYGLVHTKVPFRLERLGLKTLKGVQDPVEVYRAVLPGGVTTAPSDEGAGLPRLAVLPLTNMSPDPMDEYFADGLTEELISTISKVRDVNVISRTSVMQYKAHPKRVAEIGRELNVGTILEGSVRKAGNRVRITVQLIDPVADKHLWAENYDRNLEDIFSIQSEIAQRVASALEVHLRREDKERIGKVPTEVTEAHLLYMKGQFHIQHLSKEELMTALWYFEQAIQKDPQYALAHAAIAATYSWLGWFEMMPWSEAYSKAEAAAKKALELDPALAEAHLTLSGISLSSRDFKGFLRENRRALELNPSLATAHWQAGNSHNFARRFEEARMEAQKALELDPVSAETIGQAATVYLYSGRPERAAELYEKAIGIDPANSFAMNNLGLSYVRQGRYDEGIAKIRKAIEMSGRNDPGGLSDLAYALSRAGQIDEARKIAAELVSYHREHGMGAAAVASAFASVGDREAAFGWLERAYEEHSPYLTVLSVDFAFESIHTDPRFQRFLEKIGYPAKMVGD